MAPTNTCCMANIPPADAGGRTGIAVGSLRFGTPPVSRPSAFPLSGPATLDVTFQANGAPGSLQAPPAGRSSKLATVKPGNLCAERSGAC